MGSSATILADLVSGMERLRRQMDQVQSAVAVNNGDHFMPKKTHEHDPPPSFRGYSSGPSSKVMPVQEEATMSLLEQFTFPVDPADLQHQSGENTLSESISSIERGSSNRNVLFDNAFTPPLRGNPTQSSSGSGFIMSTVQPSTLPTYVLPNIGSRQELLVRAVLAMLPTDFETRQLTETYLCGPYHCGWHILHTSTFRDEVIAFLATPPEIRHVSTDPAWLAILMMTCMFARYPGYTVYSESMPLINGEQSRIWYEASRTAMEASNWDSQPQIRHIQVVLLYIPYLFHYGNSVPDKNAALMHISAAVTTMVTLGLDRLHPDMTNLPMRDLALKHLPRPLAYHICQRLFHWIDFQDGSFTGRNGRWRVHQESPDVRTKFLLNVNDADFRDGQVPKSRPDGEVTDTTVPQVASVFATQLREWTSSLRDDSTVDYALILQRDLEMRMNALERLPSPFEADAAGGRFNFMLCSLFCSMHNRLMRMHRPFLAKGYTCRKFEPSRLAAVSSASKIIAAEHLFDQMPHLRPTFQKRWILGAAITLVVDLVFARQSPTPSDEIASKESSVQSALDIFTQNQPVDRTPKVTLQCRRTIETMLAALNDLAPSASYPPDIEAFLTGISTDMKAMHDLQSSALMEESVPSFTKSDQGDAVFWPFQEVPLDFDMDISSFLEQRNEPYEPYAWFREMNEVGVP